MLALMRRVIVATYDKSNVPSKRAVSGASRSYSETMWLEIAELTTLATGR